MFKQIRTLMSEDISLEGEAVEMDETYMGTGKAKNKHYGKRGGNGRSLDDQNRRYSAWWSVAGVLWLA